MSDFIREALAGALLRCYEENTSSAYTKEELIALHRRRFPPWSPSRIVTSAERKLLPNGVMYYDNAIASLVRRGLLTKVLAEESMYTLSAKGVQWFYDKKHRK